MALPSVSTRITTAETRLATVLEAIERSEVAGQWSGGEFSVQRGALADLYKERDRIQAQLNSLYLLQRRQASGKAGGLGVRGARFQ